MSPAPLHSPQLPDEADAPGVPTRASLRQLLRAVLRTDPELDSFCLDYCSEVFELFTAGMTRIAKLNLLLEREEPAELLAKLRLFNQEGTAEHEHRAASAPKLASQPDDAVPPPDPSSTPSLARGHITDAEESNRRVRGSAPLLVLALGGVAGGTLLWGGERMMSRREPHGPGQQIMTQPLSPSRESPDAGHPGRRFAPQISVRGGWLRRSKRELEQLLSPSPAVFVQSFEIDVREVTVAAYRECVEAHACPPAYTTPLLGDDMDDPLMQKEGAHCNAERPERLNHPINCVDWTQAASYCAWAGRRLPTEDEWLFAARGEVPRDYAWGPETLDHRSLNACGMECVVGMRLLGSNADPLYRDDDGWSGTAPVGSFPRDRSPVGALDMTGNVAEWTSSCYRSAACGPGDTRVYMSGSFLSGGAEPPRLGNRQKLAPGSRDITIGFRCAR